MIYYVILNGYKKGSYNYHKVYQQFSDQFIFCCYPEFFTGHII